MKEILYRVSLEYGTGNIIYRCVCADGERRCEAWYPGKKKWDDHPDANRAFTGLGQSEPLSEKEAMAILPPEAF